MATLYRIGARDLQVPMQYGHCMAYESQCDLVYRSLAVGGSDDCVQVLVSPPSCTHSPTTSHNSHPTLFNYCESLSQLAWNELCIYVSACVLFASQENQQSKVSAHPNA